MSGANGLGRWSPIIRSYILSLRASRRYGKSEKLRKTGRLPEALLVAREGLSILRSSGVIRDNPAEGTVIVFLTTTVEGIAHTLGEPGASLQDLEDSLQFLRDTPCGENAKLKDFRGTWLPYLEQRIEYNRYYDKDQWPQNQAL